MAFAGQTSVYAAALIWTAVEENIVLVVPSTAVAVAWAELDAQQHPALEVLLRLPVTVVDILDAERARTIGILGGDQQDTHAAACARERGWPLITARYTRYSGLTVEELP